MTNLIHNLFMEITTECNLRCQICDLWRRKDSISKLNIENKLKFLKNLFAWAEKCYPDSREDVNVILTGGEPFLFPDQVFMISDICRENHHKCYINTNGSLIRPCTDKILDSGLTAVTISIDSHHSKIHDNLRQSPGLFKSVMETIKILKDKKIKEKYPIKICIQSILGEWNIREIVEQVEFFKDLGIDGMQFQPFQHPLGRLIAFGGCKESNFFPNSHDEIDYSIDSLIKLKNKNNFIMNSVEEIQLYGQYFKNPESLPNRSCKAFEQNLIIDVCGNAKFCFNKSLEPPDKIGNILTQKIDVLLNGKEATLVKESMRNCFSPCGIMMCHVSSNLRD